MIKKIIKLIEKNIERLVYKEVYYKTYESNTKFNYKAESYIRIYRFFSHDNHKIMYRCCIPNVSFPCKTKIECILRALEHESIGMAKYNIVKELLVKKEIKNFHY